MTGRLNPIYLYGHKYKNNNSNEPPKKIDCSTINSLDMISEYMACRHYNSFEYCFEIFNCFSKVNKVNK